MAKEAPEKMEKVEQTETPEEIMESVHKSALDSMQEEVAGSLMETPASEEEALQNFDKEVRGLMEKTRNDKNEVLASSVSSREALAQEVIKPLV
ncbi:hypothetical protein GF354_05250 [Candidatus Peregrinibacteria bacterium]|nr:hypothetical protein [Candidatus Peregrinibacteria bacterium]